MALIRRASPTDAKQISPFALQRSSQSPVRSTGVLQAQRRKLHELHREVRRVQNEGGSTWDKKNLDAYIDRVSEQINSLDRELEMVADNCTRTPGSPPPLGPVAQIAIQNAQMIMASSPSTSARFPNSITLPMPSSPQQSMSQFVVSASGVSTSFSPRGSLKAALDGSPRAISPPRNQRSVSPSIIRRSPSPGMLRRENPLEPSSPPVPMPFVRQMSPRPSRPNPAYSGIITAEGFITGPTKAASPLYLGLNSHSNLSGLRTRSSLSTPSSQAYPLPARAPPQTHVPLQSQAQVSRGVSPAWNTSLRSPESFDYQTGSEKVILGSSLTAPMMHSNGSATLRATQGFDRSGSEQIRPGSSLTIPSVPSSSFRPSQLGSAKVTSDIVMSSTPQLSYCGSIKSSAHEACVEGNGANDSNDRTSYLSGRRDFVPLEERQDRNLSAEAVKLQRKLALIQDSSRRVV